MYLLNVNNFLEGYGHTVIYMKFKFKNLGLNYGIIDIKEASIPTIKDVPVDINGILDPSSIIEMYNINSLNRELANYYDQVVLNDIIIGTMDSVSIQKYFNFLNNIYFSLGNKKLEKFLYDSIAIILGYYPSLKVTESDYNQLFSDKRVVLILAYSWLWSIRILICAIILYLITISIFFFKKNYSKNQYKNQ
tara:strand:+ start:356 stop:931 length:576 start_codon:yes stop_codon:yes gene_type:complete